MAKGPPTRRTKSIDEVCVDLRRSSWLSSFRYLKYDTLDNDDRIKVEEVVIDMMENHKLAPNEVENKIPIDLYNRLDIRWKKVEKEEKNTRTSTLAKVMPDLSQEQKDTSFERYMNIFIPKFIIFMILQNKTDVVIQKNELLWKSTLVSQ